MPRLCAPARPRDRRHPRRPCGGSPRPCGCEAACAAERSFTASSAASIERKRRQSVHRRLPTNLPIGADRHAPFDAGAADPFGRRCRARPHRRAARSRSGNRSPRRLFAEHLEGSPGALFRLTREGRAGEVPNVDYPDCDTMVWWHCWMWSVRDDDDRVIGIMQGCQMHYAPVSGAADLRLIERP